LVNGMLVRNLADIDNSERLFTKCGHDRNFITAPPRGAELGIFVLGHRREPET